MVGIYSRIGTYSCSENTILHFKSFFPQKWHSKFTFLHTSAPSLCAQRQILTSSSTFYLKKDLSIRCAKGQLSLPNRLSASPWLWGSKCLKILPGLGIPSQDYPGGYKLQKLKTVICEKSQGRNLFSGLESASLILSEEVASSHF